MKIACVISYGCSEEFRKKQQKTRKKIKKVGKQGKGKRGNEKARKIEF